MYDKIMRQMIAVSNNSLLTESAASVLAKLPIEDIEKVTRWLQHARNLQEQKMQQAKRNLRFLK